MARKGNNPSNSNNQPTAHPSVRTKPGALKQLGIAPTPGHSPTNNAPVSVPPTTPIKMGPSLQIAQALQTKVGVPAPANGGLQVAAAQRQVLALTPAMLASGQWVKVSTVGKAFKQAGVPISRLVKYFGGDRGFLPTLALPQGTSASSAGTNSHFTTLYYGHTRYMPTSALTAGLAQAQAIMAGSQTAVYNAAPTLPTLPTT